MEELQAFVTKSFESSETSKNGPNVISLKRNLPKFDATAWFNAIGETTVNHRKSGKSTPAKTRTSSGATTDSSDPASVAHAVPVAAKLPSIPVTFLGSSDSELTRIALFKRGTTLGKVSPPKRHKTSAGS